MLYSFSLITSWKLLIFHISVYSESSHFCSYYFWLFHSFFKILCLLFCRLAFQSECIQSLLQCLSGFFFLCFIEFLQLFLCNVKLLNFAISDQTFKKMKLLDSLNKTPETHTTHRNTSMYYVKVKAGNFCLRSYLL